MSTCTVDNFLSQLTIAVSVVDLLGPLPISNFGNKYVIVATGYLTKWVETRALPVQTSYEVSKFFVEQIVLRHGAPRVLLSARGTPFLARLTEDVISILGCKHVTTTAYHPQCNGLVEKFNKTLADILSMYVAASHKDWESILPFVTFAYNTSRHDTTKFSPFHLTYGREPILPSDVIDPDFTFGSDDPECYGLIIKNYLLKAHDVARRNVAQIQVKSIEYYNKKHREVIYNPGDKVLVFTLVRKVGKSEKLIHNFIGPFEIINSRSGDILDQSDLPGQCSR